MTARLLSLRLTQATVLREGEMQRRSVVIRDGVIAKGPLPEVDLSGYLILPGIVDLHGDAFERHLSPRPGALFPMAAGLAATERDAAAHGVTTAWLAQGWSWEGGLRSPDFAETLMAALESYRAQALIDLRLHLRVETHTVDTFDRLLAAIRRHGVGYVVFNNHLDQVLRAPPDPLYQVAEAAQAQAPRVPRYLCRLADAFDLMGVLYGSHDDPDAQTREYYSMIGARICEFPTCHPPAAVAHAVGDKVLMGAPNVVRGRSRGGNVSARMLIARRCCDALVSDYAYPSLAQAAFVLADEGLRSLPGAWAMISSIPAEMMHLSDRGQIDYGRRADLAIVNARTRQIEATICAGRLAYMAGPVAGRFLRVADQIAKGAAA